MTFVGNLSSADLAELRVALLGDPTLLPDGFVAWLAPYIALRGLDIPVSQINGFSQFTAQFDSVTTEQTTSSTGFTDIGTAGPTVSGLSDGKYVLIWGCAEKTNDTSSAAMMGMAVNGSTLSQANVVQTNTATYTSGAYATTQTLSAGHSGNTLQAKYAAGLGTATASFMHRWLVVLRYANP